MTSLLPANVNEAPPPAIAICRAFGYDRVMGFWGVLIDSQRVFTGRPHADSCPV